MRRICGTDTALYLVFMRMASNFFIVVTIINCLLLLPIYVLGNPDPVILKEKLGYKKELSQIEKLSLANISGGTYGVFFAFIITMSYFCVGATYLLYKYWRIATKWRYNQHDHAQIFNDNDIATHSIFLTGFPKKILLEEAKEQLELVFDKIFPGQVVKAVPIGNFNKLYRENL